MLPLCFFFFFNQVMKTCKKMGIQTVAVHSEVDSSAVSDHLCSSSPVEIRVEFQEGRRVFAECPAEWRRSEFNLACMCVSRFM